jgi:hypothetical protein
MWLTGRKHARMKRVAILQSNYIPWKGYFDIINLVDEFVIFDGTQYTKRDWRNRNIIKTKDGLLWLTIPIEGKGRYNQTIKETRVADHKWALKHWETIRHSYSAAPIFKDFAVKLEEAYITVQELKFLSDINLIFIKKITEYLGVRTKISFSSDYILEGDRSEKALSICLQAGAGEYLTGPAAKTYLDVEIFRNNGIMVKWMDYSGYKVYPQLYSPFIHEVSIIDLLFNTGCNAVKYLNSF